MEMTDTVSNDTQAGDKPANISFSVKIKNYLLKMRDIGDAKTLNLLKHAKQAMKTLKKRVTTKHKNVNASQMMNKMTKTVQKISQKMNSLKKKI